VVRLSSSASERLTSPAKRLVAGYLDAGYLARLLVDHNDEMVALAPGSTTAPATLGVAVLATSTLGLLDVTERCRSLCARLAMLPSCSGLTSS
jgi:hypothetical protein